MILHLIPVSPKILTFGAFSYFKKPEGVWDESFEGGGLFVNKDFITGGRYLGANIFRKFKWSLNF